MSAGDLDATLSGVYSLPEETNLSDFVGCPLEVVSVSQHQVNLSFDGLGNIGVSIEGNYSVLRPDGEETLYPAAPKGAGELVALLGSVVTAAVVTEPGTTSFRFADGSVISVFDSEAHYESHQIFIGERLIVV